MLETHPDARYETSIQALVNRMAYYGLTVCELIDYMAVKFADFNPERWSEFRASDLETIEENVARAEVKIDRK